MLIKTINEKMVQEVVGDIKVALYNFHDVFADSTKLYGRMAASTFDKFKGIFSRSSIDTNLLNQTLRSFLKDDDDNISVIHNNSKVFHLLEEITGNKLGKSILTTTNTESLGNKFGEVKDQIIAINQKYRKVSTNKQGNLRTV